MSSNCARAASSPAPRKRRHNSASLPSTGAASSMASMEGAHQCLEHERPPVNEHEDEDFQRQRNRRGGHHHHSQGHQNGTDDEVDEEEREEKAKSDLESRTKFRQHEGRDQLHIANLLG